MANKTAISWTDATWNPWRGCTKVSPGCASCYMFRQERRYGRDPSEVVRSKTTFNDPLNWDWPRSIFTCSLSDFFHPDADDWRAEAWEIIRRTPRHTYQILTKRPELIAEYLPPNWGTGWPNVWLGVSVESQGETPRIDKLANVPAAGRFVSAEPLLGPLELGGYLRRISMIDWLIVGGESGGRPGHPPRIPDPDWIRALRDAAVGHGVPFHFKQWGGPRPGGPALLDGREWRQMPEIAVPAREGSLS